MEKDYPDEQLIKEYNERSLTNYEFENSMVISTFQDKEKWNPKLNFAVQCISYIETF